MCRLVGITYRQLDYWARTDLVKPSLAEALNTALEALCDRLAPEPHPLVRRAKDVAAAGVLLAALAAAAAGSCILLPKLLAWLASR